MIVFLRDLSPGEGALFEDPGMELGLGTEVRSKDGSIWCASALYGGGTLYNGDVGALIWFARLET